MKLAQYLAFASVLLATSVQAQNTIIGGMVPTMRQVTNILHNVLVGGTNVVIQIGADGKMTFHSGGTNELSGGGNVNVAGTFGGDNRIIRSHGSGTDVQPSDAYVDDSGQLILLQDLSQIEDLSEMTPVLTFTDANSGDGVVMFFAITEDGPVFKLGYHENE